MIFLEMQLLGKFRERLNFIFLGTFLIIALSSEEMSPTARVLVILFLIQDACVCFWVVLVSWILWISELLNPSKYQRSNVDNIQLNTSSFTLNRLSHYIRVCMSLVYFLRPAMPKHLYLKYMLFPLLLLQLGCCVCENMSKFYNLVIGFTSV